MTDSLIDSFKQISVNGQQIIELWAKNHPFMEYNPTEKEIAYFYRHEPWLSVRQRVLNRDNYIDQFELVENDHIISGNIVHHIIHLRERWDLPSDIRKPEQRVARS